MIELDKYEQQIVLACKSHGEWAKKEDRFKGVKVVIGQYYAIDVDELEIYTMYHCLTKLYLKVKENSMWSLQNFMESLFQEKWSGKHTSTINMEHIVRNFISEISELPTMDENKNNIFNELEPDYEILNKGI